MCQWRFRRGYYGGRLYNIMRQIELAVVQVLFYRIINLEFFCLFRSTFHDRLRLKAERSWRAMELLTHMLNNPPYAPHAKSQW